MHGQRLRDDRFDAPNRRAADGSLRDIPIAAGQAREPSREASAPEPGDTTLHR